MRARLVVMLLAVLGVLAPVTASSSSAATTAVEFAGDAGAARNTATPWVVLPTSIQPGDRLVLTLSLASASPTISSPTGVTGWTLEGTRVSRTMKTLLWSKVAVATDAGARVNIRMSGTVKSTVQVAAYRGVDPGALTVVSRAETNTSVNRTTPTADAPDGAWVMSYWATKSAGVMSWSTPASVTQRRAVNNTGSGRIASVLADSGAPVGAGTQGGLVARSNSTSTNATTWTVVLPGAPTGGNQDPVADFSETCTGLECTFDGSDSADPEGGDLASYEWDFGDGDTDTGSVVTHPFDTAGSYDVTLTITDAEGATGTLTRTIDVTEPDPDEVVPVTADDETTPVNESGDAADDPAIWVHPTDPSQSLVIGNDKQGSLEVYGLDGSRIQRITTGTSFWGNVDVRQGVTIGTRTRDVVIGYNAGLRTYTVDPTTRVLTPIGDGTGTIPTNGGEGLCAYHASSGDLFVYVITRAGRIREYQIVDTDDDGLLQGTGEPLREVQVGSEAEGCVVDDATGDLYVSEEDTGLWKYPAGWTSNAQRVMVDAIQPNGHLAFDVEGVTLAQTGPTSGYLIVSAQNGASPNQSYFSVYDRETNAFVSNFRISGGTEADGCERTDGITAYVGDLGASYPKGLFVCQDNGNTLPASGNQNFKLTRLEKILPGL